MGAPRNLYRGRPTTECYQSASGWQSVCGPGPLAQLAEQRTFNPRVVGSIPTGPT